MNELFFAIIQVSVVPCLVCFILGGIIGIISMIIIDKIYDRRERLNSDDETGVTDGD